MHETLAAEDRPALSWPERDGSFLPALRTSGAGLDARMVVRFTRNGCGIEDGHALRLAGFAAFGLVLELFVVKEKLFPGGERKVGAAVDAGQYLVLKFH